MPIEEAVRASPMSNVAHASSEGERRRGFPSIAVIEVLVILAVVPFAWYPRWGGGWPLLAIPALWLVRWRARGVLSVRTPYDLPIVVILAMLPLTILPVFDWSLAAPKLASILVGIALVYAFANSLTTRRLTLFGVSATVVLFGGGIALVGLIGTEWTVGKVPLLDSLYRRIPLLIQGVTRFGGRGAIHPNEIAGVLALLLPLAIAMSVEIVGRRSAAPRLLVIAIPGVSMLMGLVLLMTLSRSAFIGLAASLLLISVWRVLTIPTSSRMRVPGLVGFGLLTMILVGAGSWLITNWIQSSKTGLDSFAGRVELWQRAVLMLWDFPFTGIGMGQFEPVLHALYVPYLSSIGSYVPHAHNFYLQLGLDLGLPGGLAFMAMLGTFFWSLWMAYRRVDDAMRAVIVGLAAGMLGFLVYGLTDAIAVGARGAIGLWVVLGLSAAVVSTVSLEHRSRA